MHSFWYKIEQSTSYETNKNILEDAMIAAVMHMIHHELEALAYLVSFAT